MAHPNEELVRKGFAAFQSGDMATVSELFTDDIVWHVPGRHQLAGDFRGKDEVLGAFKNTFELTNGSFKLEMHDLLANDTHVIAMVHAMGEREGRTLDDNSVQVFHVTDGKVSEQWLYPGDPYATDEFWGQG
jgi:ketosteroid isomerase-like protein